jgi:predicted kinase
VRKYVTSTPSLILVIGVAGSGKTTLARKILRHICAVYLDNNHIADAFFPHTRRGGAYERLRPGFYKVLYTIAEENLKLGNSVLLDVPHVKEVQTSEWRGLIRRLVKKARADLVVIRCFCSEQTLLRRIRSRSQARDHWKLKHWNEFLMEQPIRVWMPWRHLEIDSEKQLSANVSEAVRYIKSRRR